MLNSQIKPIEKSSNRGREKKPEIYDLNNYFEVGALRGQIVQVAKALLKWAFVRLGPRHKGNEGEKKEVFQVFTLGSSPVSGFL